MRPAASPDELPATLPPQTAALVRRLRLAASPREWLAKQEPIDLARIAGTLGVTLSLKQSETIERILFAEWQRTAQQ